jgi:hypothetical protein
MSLSEIKKYFRRKNLSPEEGDGCLSSYCVGGTCSTSSQCPVSDHILGSGLCVAAVHVSEEQGKEGVRSLGNRKGKGRKKGDFRDTSSSVFNYTQQSSVSS